MIKFFLTYHHKKYKKIQGKCFPLLEFISIFKSKTLNFLSLEAIKKQNFSCHEKSENLENTK